MEKRRTRRKKVKTRESCQYAVETLDWGLDYSLSLDPQHKISAGPYWEYAHLKVNGRFVEPQRLLDRAIDVIILGERHIGFAMEKPLEVTWQPRAVGGLTVSKSMTDCYISIPFDALTLIAGGMEHGRVRFVTFFGEALYRNKADIRSVSFERSYVPEEND
ncbi:MAG: hypothetical protein A4E60_02596 [Syntrophorhabdus sp. PtaB.Bin047]|jgi:hypothetical protein|nr:MAG: hypothetical protein A4E60_02596 [Syntrophorhabdus sp. PtaB.Bin047]OPY76504.1 MAG: hypothetical protein A4E63_00075 [Syntrophorhabdus sp. PtaU1.Bin050]